MAQPARQLHTINMSTSNNSNLSASVRTPTSQPLSVVKTSNSQPLSAAKMANALPLSAVKVSNSPQKLLSATKVTNSHQQSLVKTATRPSPVTNTSAIQSPATKTVQISTLKTSASPLSILKTTHQLPVSKSPAPQFSTAKTSTPISSSLINGTLPKTPNLSNAKLNLSTQSPNTPMEIMRTASDSHSGLDFPMNQVPGSVRSGARLDSIFDNVIQQRSLVTTSLVNSFSSTKSHNSVNRSNCSSIVSPSSSAVVSPSKTNSISASGHKTDAPSSPNKSNSKSRSKQPKPVLSQQHLNAQQEIVALNQVSSTNSMPSPVSSQLSSSQANIFRQQSPAMSTSCGPIMNSQSYNVSTAMISQSHKPSTNSLQSSMDVPANSSAACGLPALPLDTAIRQQTQHVNFPRPLSSPLLLPRIVSAVPQAPQFSPQSVSPSHSMQRQSLPSMLEISNHLSHQNRSPCLSPRGLNEKHNFLTSPPSSASSSSTNIFLSVMDTTNSCSPQTKLSQQQPPQMRAVSPGQFTRHTTPSSPLSMHHQHFMSSSASHLKPSSPSWQQAQQQAYYITSQNQPQQTNQQQLHNQSYFPTGPAVQQGANYFHHHTQLQPSNQSPHLVNSQDLFVAQQTQDNTNYHQFQNTILTGPRYQSPQDNIYTPRFK